MDQPFVYKNLTLSEFQTHIRHLGEKLNDKESLEVRVDDIDSEFTLIKDTYKVKPTTLSLLIRTSEVGREEIHVLHSWLAIEPYVIKVRLSPKKKYISQIKIVWSVTDPLYPANIISCLEKICRKMGGAWPPTLFVGYYSYKMDYQNLPGELEVDSLVWKAGYKLGLVIGKISAKF
ncbi:MAG: hypothetical protein WD397_16875 [Wenzhouxiangellaceae bacterium]